MARKLSRKGLVKSLDDLARTLLRLKQEDTCEKCGLVVHGRNSQVHHIRSRKWYNTRWELFNLVLLCAKCHRQYHDGIFGKDWFKEYAPECYKLLQDKIKEYPETYRESDLLEVKDSLNAQIKETKNDM